MKIKGEIRISKSVDLYLNCQQYTIIHSGKKDETWPTNPLDFHKITISTQLCIKLKNIETWLNKSLDFYQLPPPPTG